MTTSAPPPAAALPSNALQVSERQRDNPVLSHLTNTKWEYSKTLIPDFATAATCAYFLSVKYHILHSNYIENRLREVGRNYRTRVLLVLVDDANCSKPLLELNRIGFVHDFTLVVAWSNVECSRYLEALKEYEGKSSTCIQEKVETEYVPKVQKCLTAVKSINKTDTNTLLDIFGNVSNIFSASEHQLLMTPGLGDKKVKRLYQAFNEPFIATKKQK